MATDLVLPSINSIDSWIVSSIGQSNPENGLAIIIGCPDSYNRDHKHLPGVKYDVSKLKHTFNKLRFATLCLFDPSKEHIMEVLRYTSRMNIDGIQLPPSWKRIVLTFSGHGDQRFLYTKDNAFELEKDIVSLLMPSNATELAHIPKLFFIDACRGSGVDTGVEISSYFLRDGDLVSRGKRVPSAGNYLIACSTLLGMEALESRAHGGCWMQLLTAQLVNEENIDKSIEGILKTVNQILLDTFNEKRLQLQQPEYKSSLNGEDIKLLKEAYEIIQQQQQHQMQLQYLLQSQDEPRQIQQEQVYSSQQQQYDALPQQHVTQQYGIPQQNVSISQQPHYGMPLQPPQLPQQQLHLTQQQQYVSPQQHHVIPQQHYVMPLSPQQHYVMPQQHVSPQQQQYVVRNGTAASPVVSSRQDSVGSSNQQQGLYREELNQYFQKKIITKPHSFEDIPSPPGQFKCSVRVIMTDSTVIRGMSLVSFPVKADAKESAAKEAVTKIKAHLSQSASDQQGRGISTFCKKKDKKMPKSELKEYFDAKMKGRKVESEIRYDTKQESGGYKSRVYCPEISDITGNVYPTKQEAEHSAAKEALKKLRS